MIYSEKSGTHFRERNGYSASNHEEKGEQVKSNKRKVGIGGNITFVHITSVLIADFSSFSAFKTDGGSAQKYGQ